MHVPHGWIDLEPMFLESHGDVVVLDCLVTRVCLGRGPGQDRSGLTVGEPVAFGLHPGPGGGSVSRYPGPGRVDQPGLREVHGLLERWIDEGAEVSLLRDDGGDVLLLSKGEELLALELAAP